jgi:cyclic-di-AMP phosphodiesterase PgpH
VKEEEFRYPGPKPQTREAGIIMIADAVEAAARSLDDPTPGRLKGTIQGIIENTFLDGQLDECDLTLKDLRKIADAFLKVLLSMKHERIKYPGFQTAERKKKAANKANGKKKQTEKEQKAAEAGAPDDGMGGEPEASESTERREEAPRLTGYDDSSYVSDDESTRETQN